ncbi:hypothetical protein [Nocardia sp. SYP-A9097]|uniref:hypothetical protein n=1 Tax=Nocardia sp. SYP-A9097 TaxID=2663237 RepID=UPI0028159196|nr:hypothetical protein [Nocardia sp. SYP-A9097]
MNRKAKHGNEMHNPDAGSANRDGRRDKPASPPLTGARTRRASKTEQTSGDGHYVCQYGCDPSIAEVAYFQHSNSIARTKVSLSQLRRAKSTGRWSDWEIEK